MKLQATINNSGFGLARSKIEGSTVVSVGDCDVTFFAGELDFLNKIPRLSNKSKNMIIREFASLIASEKRQ